MSTPKPTYTKHTPSKVRDKGVCIQQQYGTQTHTQTQHKTHKTRTPQQTQTTHDQYGETNAHVYSSTHTYAQPTSQNKHTQRPAG